MGNSLSILEQSFPPAPRWSINEIPDLTGRVMMVTGGNSGIGYDTCKALLSKNAKVYMAARCPKKANAAITRLKEETGNKSPCYLQLDLGDLQSVRLAATQFLQQESRLHCLFNNGGVYAPPLSEVTVEGYDLQFGTNVLGHYLFTKLLIPIMIDTAKNSPCAKGFARIINTSSVLHFFAPSGGVDYVSLEPHSDQADKRRKAIGPEGLYAQSKWGLIALSNELARRYGDEGIVSVSLHPGNVRTDIQRHVTTGAVIATLSKYVLFDSACGALTQLYAATAIPGGDLNGKYLAPWARIGQPRADTLDETACQILWQWLEAQVD
ncbi:short chain dehydrogenase [Ceratobasidium sp. AG-Ba]|nr:short chain dehydrogenase [Ceratobasidium sp. AG-Ba]